MMEAINSEETDSETKELAWNSEDCYLSTEMEWLTPEVSSGEITVLIETITLIMEDRALTLIITVI